MTIINKTDRREFLRKGLSLGLTVGGVWMFGPPRGLLYGQAASGIPDLVAVKNGEPDAMFRKAVSLMGGMGQFIKKGQTVVIKPNIGFPRRPEVGATTNPLLVKTIIEECRQAGAKRVYVFDNVVSPSSGNARNCYALSGIEEAAKAAGASVIPMSGFNYREVKIPGAKTLKTAAVNSLILDADVLINVPVLKHHGSTYLSIAMKNLMGVVENRMSYHLNGLDQCIADFCLLRKPDLNVVDAYRVLKSQGPGGPRDPAQADVELKKTLLMSRDIVAVDAAAAMIFGAKPEEIEYIGIAHRQKTGNMNLKGQKIVTYTM